MYRRMRKLNLILILMCDVEAMRVLAQFLDELSFFSVTEH